MDVQIITQAIRDISCDALIVAAARKRGGQEVQLMKTTTTVDGLLDRLICERCTDGEFKGNLGEILTIHPMGRLTATRVIVIRLRRSAKD